MFTRTKLTFVLTTTEFPFVVQVCAVTTPPVVQVVPSAELSSVTEQADTVPKTVHVNW